MISIITNEYKAGPYDLPYAYHTFFWQPLLLILSALITFQKNWLSLIFTAQELIRIYNHMPFLYDNTWIHRPFITLSNTQMINYSFLHHY